MGSSAFLVLASLAVLAPFAAASDVRYGPFGTRFLPATGYAAAPLLAASGIYSLEHLRRRFSIRCLVTVLWGLLAGAAVHLWVLGQSFPFDADFWYRDTRLLTWKILAAEAILAVTAGVAAGRRLKGRETNLLVGFAVDVVALGILLYPARFPERWVESDIARINIARLTREGDLIIEARRTSAVPGRSVLFSSSLSEIQGSAGDDALLVRQRSDGTLRCLTRRPITVGLALEADAGRAALLQAPTPWRRVLGDIAEERFIDASAGTVSTLCRYRVYPFRQTSLEDRGCPFPSLWGSSGSWADSRDNYSVRGQLTNGESFEVRTNGEFDNRSAWVYQGSLYAFWVHCSGQGTEDAAPCLMRLNLSNGRTSRIAVDVDVRADRAIASPDGSTAVLGPGYCPPAPQSCPGIFYLLDTSGRTKLLLELGDPRRTIVAWRQMGDPVLLKRDSLSAWIAKEDAPRQLEFVRELREIGDRYYPIPGHGLASQGPLLEFDLLAHSARRIAGQIADLQVLSDSLLFVSSESDGQTVTRYWPANGRRENLLHISTAKP